MTADYWPLADVIDACAEHGVEWVGPWRHKLEDVEDARRRIDAAGLKVSSLCRGGFFAADNADADNRLAVEQAAALGTDVLVLVCGPPRTRDLAAARATIEAGHRAAAPARARARRAARDRAAAPDDDRRALGDRDARRGARHGRADRRRPRRRRDRRLPHVLGPADRRADRARGGPDPRLPRQRLAARDPAHAARARDDGRRDHRAAAIALAGRRGGLRRADRGRDPQPGDLGAATGGADADDDRPVRDSA